MTQEWWVSLLFFIAGHLGVLARALYMFIKTGQRSLRFFDEYLEENSAVFALSVILYWIIALLWAFTDAVGFLGGLGDALGIVPGIINAWSAGIAFLSDIFFFVLINRIGGKWGVDKLGDKVSQIMPKLSKDE